MRTFACHNLLLFILLCVSSKLLAANASVPIDQINTPTPLGPWLSYLVDASGELDFDSIKQAPETQWTAVTNDSIIGGFTRSVYWVKFSISNQSQVKKPWLMEIDYPIIDWVEFYQTDQNGQYQKTLVGDRLPFHERPIDYRNFVFPLSAPPMEHQTYYLRFETESSMYIALNILPGNSLVESMDDKLIIYGFIYGIVFLASIYCLINAVFLRERMYLFIAIGILGSLGYSLSINGFAYQYLWPTNPWMQSVAIPLFLNICFGFALFYSREFLELKTLSPLFDKIVIVLCSICLVVGALSLVLSYGTVIRVSTVFAIVMSFAAFLAGAISLYKGNKAARYYLVGWMALFIGAVTFALKSLGVLPSSLFTVWAQEFGFAGIAIFLTLAQSDRFFQAQKKHEAEQTFAMNAIRDAEKKYRSLFENSLEGIFQMDLSGRLVNANKAFAEILGSEDVGFLLAQSHPSYSLNCLSEDEQGKFKALLHQENAVTGHEAQIELPSGEVRWISVSIQQIKDKSGVGTHYEGAIANITDTKKRESAEKQQRMAEASTEAKSLFLANMSHEIRTPMNAIIGFTDLALDRNKDLQLADFLQKIRMASSNLLGIINDILDFSKIEAGKLEIEHTPFSLKEVLNNLTNIVSANVESKNLKLDIDVDDDIPDQLIGDPLRIGQVLLNLTNNAIKFTSKGKVSVSLELISLNKPEMSIYLCGRVSDTGIGIPQDKLSTLFSSFTQADDSTTRKFGGTGLGLSISKQLVDMMGGEISVESEDGKGSTFSFTLACNLQDRRKRTNPHFNNHQLPLNVLVVDDQQESRELIEKTIITLSHRVTSVASANEAIHELKRKQHEGQPYDVLLTDWLMPDQDGISCCQQIKEDEEINNPRMIVITGYDQEEARVKAKAIGVDAYMLKPLNINELSTTLKTLFKDRRINPPTKPQASSSEFNFEGLNVLVVEDVAMNQDLAIEILSKKGIHTSVASNGQEGLEAVKSGTFDIVLMDMQMPVMDGCQATEEIRKFKHQLPVIAMTANAMAEDKNKCLAAGMNDYITKPINPKEMFNAISHWVNLSRELDETTASVTEPSAKPPPAKLDGSKSVAMPSTNQRGLSDASAAFLASLDADLETRPEIESNTSLPNSLPGIDLQEGLTRCQDNEALYIRFLADFKRDYEQSNEQFKQLAQIEDAEGFKALAHTIKGLAGNLAAKPLAEAARALEAAWTQNTDSKSALIERFASELTLLLSSIDELLTIKEQPKTPTAKETSGNPHDTFDQTALQEKLEILQKMTKSQKFDANEVALEYMEKWPVEEHKPDLAKIAEALDSFDFESAERLIRTLQKALEF